MEFNRYAENYDKSFMGKGSSRFYIDLIREIDVRDGDVILDVGCGTGTVLEFISREKQIKGYGIDVSESMIEVANSKDIGCIFMTGDAGKLLFEDESVDIITACMAYHHFPDQRKFREEAWRVLKPGGCLYISDPRFPAPVRGMFNTFFRDAGFHSTKGNSLDFANTGFIEMKITKDAYVQVLCFKKK